MHRAVLVTPFIVLATALSIGAQGATAEVAAKQLPLASLPITERIKVPIGPGWLETAFGSLWVSKINSKMVLRIDPIANSIVAKIPAGIDPESFAIGLGFLWVADVKGHSILKIDPKTNRVVATIPAKLAADPEGSIAIGNGSIWFLSDEGGTDSGTLTRIDADSGRVTNNIHVKPQSHAAISAFDSIWVTSTGEGAVMRIDPRLNKVTAEIRVPPLPRFLVASEDGIWVLCQGDGSLTRIDPSTNQVVANIDLGVPGVGGDLSVGASYVWASAEGIPLSQVDPKTNQLVRQFVGGRKDDTMRIGFGSAWVLSERQGHIWKADLQQLMQLPLRH